MRHKKILLSAAGFGCATLAIVTAVSSTNGSNGIIMHGDVTTYKMVFSSSQNKFHSEVGTTAKSGDATARTNQGTSLKFHYESAKGPVTATVPTWHIFADGGCFYNVDPIHGLKSISLTFKTADKSYKILYSRDASFDQSADFTSATGDAQAFDFNGYQPNYFKVVNSSGGNLNISSVEVGFSCLNSYPCLTLSSEDEAMGSVSGAGAMTAGEEVTIKATPNQGYKFVGWYSGDDLISSSSTYTFDMPHEDLDYTAKFAWTPYTVELNVNDGEMGSVSGAGSYIYQQEVTLSASPAEHCSFAGWYDGDDLVSTDNPYVFSLPDKSLSYTAKFVKSHAITIVNEDETKLSVSSPSEWGEGLEVTVSAAASKGYALDYWSDADGNELSSDASYTFVMPNEDVWLMPVSTTGYTLSLSSEDETKGTVSGAGQYKAGRTVTATMDHLSGTFKGWYNGEELVSAANPYTFAMPSSDLSLEARFMTKAEEEEEEARRQALGIDPVIDSESKTLTYGLYPQKRVSDAATLASLSALPDAESNGWHLLNGEYYAKKSASPYNSSYVFDDGDAIVSGTEYWFKCEPITWKILSSTDDGTYSLVSTVLLDAHRCAASYNNYANSEIRAWLNGDFYDSAFSLGGSLIQTTTVDNSAATTDSTSNSYACDNTEDKVYLLSYQDYKNTSYFADSTVRQCKMTDWAKANGAWCSTSSSCLYNGRYWTRSPDSSSSYCAWSVDGGDFRYDLVSFSFVAVRPSLRIKVAQ